MHEKYKKSRYVQGNFSGFNEIFYVFYQVFHIYLIYLTKFKKNADTLLTIIQTTGIIHT